MSRGDLSEADRRVLKGMLPIEAANQGWWSTAWSEPVHHQRHVLAVLLRYAMARCCAQLWQLDTICRRFRRWSEAGVWETVSVTLAGIMTGHSSIDSTTVCGHVLAAGAKGGLVDALLAARGVGSPVSLTVWLTDEDGHSPST